jgi:hypothetical protein
MKLVLGLEMGLDWVEIYLNNKMAPNIVQILCYFVLLILNIFALRLGLPFVPSYLGQTNWDC